MIAFSFAFFGCLGCASESASNILEASIDRGSIQGTVRDQQGATVPGAKVVVKNVNTNVEVDLKHQLRRLLPGRRTRAGQVFGPRVRSRVFAARHQRSGR